jgi:formate dehydrogenase maturation protein FdhE
MPNGSLSLAQYPAAMVRLKCSKCGRSGQYHKAALIHGGQRIDPSDWS